MLKGIYQALCERLAALDVPLYEVGCLPQGQAFPYMTLSADIPVTPDQPGSITLTLWHHGPQAHSNRLTLADQVLTLIPGDGLCLDTGATRILLLGGEGIRFLHSSEALGVQLHWTLKCFPHE